MQSPEEIVSISDPGKRGRAEHNTGDRFVVGVSNLLSWIYPILMLAIVAQVFLRSAGHNQAWLDDLQWWLYGIAVLIGVGYAVTTNSHVRVDIFHANFSAQKKARIEIFALAWLFLPFIILAWDLTFHYAVSSVKALEGSDSPNGLHGLYILKVLVNISFVIIAIAIWSAYRRNLAKLTEPVLWKQLLYAFPSVLFMVNLVIFYILYWWVRFTSGPDLNPNRITREPIFGYFMTADEAGKATEVTFLNIEISITVVMTIVATAILIGAAWAFGRKSQRGA